MEQPESIDNIQYAHSFFEENQRSTVEPLSIPKIAVSRAELSTTKEKLAKITDSKNKMFLDVETKSPKPNNGDEVPDLSDGLIDEKSEAEDTAGIPLCEELKKEVKGFLSAENSEVSVYAETETNQS